MQLVSLGENLHEMFDPILIEDRRPTRSLVSDTGSIGSLGLYNPEHELILFKLSHQTWHPPPPTSKRDPNTVVPFHDPDLCFKV